MSDRAFVQRLRTSGGPSHELLVLLDAHRVLTTDQLARATGAPVRTVRHRLDRLRGAGLVDAVRPGREAGSAPRHWWLRIAGARLVAGTAAAPGRQKPSGLHVAHAAAIGEAWLAVRDHGPAAGLALREWWSDRAGWQEWESTRPSWGARLRRLTPDAVLLVDADHAGVVGTAAAFVEIDLATMSQVVLREKVTRYLAYAEDRAWEGRWPHCPPLLLLTTTQARAATFLAAAGRQLAAASRSAGLVYGGQAGRDIADARALVVAACGLVRDPAAAVVDAPVWLLPGEAATRASLPELLAGRIAAQARAQQHHDQAAAQAARRDRVDALHEICDAAADVARLLDDPAAGQLLQHWPPATRHERLDDDADVVDALLAWWADRDDPTLTARARAVLVDRHAAEWTRQAEQLLAAAGHDHPRLRAAAAALQTGRLLADYELDRLRQPPAHTQERVQEAAIEDYRAVRDDHVAAVWDRLGWRARRRTDPAQVGAEHDREHLIICGTCAIAYPRPDPTGPDWYAGEHCPHCHAGTPIPYTDRDRVPTLGQRLSAIRGRLAAGSKATVPPPRPATR
ncbi:Replication-relaxation [Micromonospora sediminicola]|uniref:Replication-relaxation n=1 Tax=Micromonospora sediminicola TaxID=946078 RepID=A0A1A9BIH7_9ACTN|nr:replication-relaxation family protein [Micromonospora sediminicola]SBT69315.1 Replication-relaxation [Micromonospora sediminicola]